MIFRELGDFVIGSRGTCRAAHLDGTGFAKQKADDHPGERRTKQGSETRAGRIFSEEGMEYFRKGPEPFRYTL